MSSPFNHQQKLLGFDKLFINLSHGIRTHHPFPDTASKSGLMRQRMKSFTPCALHRRKRAMQWRSIHHAAGTYHDWSMLHCYLDRMIKRLHSANSLRLAFEIGRLAEYAVLRKASMKPGIRAALLEFQECLAALAGQIDLLTAHPNLSASKNFPLLRAESRLRQRRAAHGFPVKKAAVSH
jgi:hypothetical protein